MQIEHRQINLRNQSIAFILRRSRRRRRSVGMRMDPQKGLIVTVPYRFTLLDVDQVLEKNAEWVLKKMAEVVAVISYQGIQEGSLVFYLGREYRIEFSEGDCRLDVDRGVICLSRVSDLTPWYKRVSTDILLDRLETFSRKLGLHYKTFRLSSAKSRWGSCSRDGVIRLSWRLVMLPIELMDYVVVHELCHLVHFDHSPAFWRQVEKTIPHHKDLRRNLKALSPKCGVF